MVILGGLELVAAGYLIHKHKENKRERERLEDEAAAQEEHRHRLQDKPRPHRRHSHSHSRVDDEDEEEREERRERRRRRRSRERREREKYEYEGRPRPHSVPARQDSAPPKMQAQRPQGQVQVEPGIVTGWPAHWPQSQTPATAPPAQAIPANQYPPDIKYGFVPDIPHDQYPPPYTSASAGPSRHSEESRRPRADTLDVRGRHSRRSVSPHLGEYSRSPTPRVRFSPEDEILGERRGRSEAPPKYRP